MKKRNVFIALFLAFTLLFVGCGDTSKDETSEVDSVENAMDEEDTDQTDPMDEEDEDAEEDIESSSTNIFDNTRNMDAYYYEVNAELADGTSYITKIWSTENKTKMESVYPESGETVIMIMDEEEDLMYIYMPDENSAMMMKYDDDSVFTDEGEQQGSQDYIEIIKELADDEEITIENGTLDGEAVKIVTGEIEGNTNIIWISEQTGFPLKSEFYMNGALESSATFTNFEDKSIDPSIFELPEGVVIQDLTNF